MPTRVLVAFDKFKDALTAPRATAITLRELRRAHPDWEVEGVPITDGGDGFASILTEAVGGEMVSVPAAGPRLERVSASVGLVDAARLPAAVRHLLPDLDLTAGRVAVIEMAAVSGLAMVRPGERDPWHTTSLGTGQLIRAAAELGARAIVLGVGGSATNDLGLGALNALGFEFRDAAGGKIRPPFPFQWERLVTVDGEAFASIPPIAIACDVTNPLLGSGGAAAVYGPQKGLQAADVSRLDAEAGRLARLLAKHCGRDAAALMSTPGAGAAGGIAFGLMTAVGARLLPGFDFVSRWLDLDRRIAAADLVITGEGRYDASSASGKGPGEIVRRARARGRRVVVLAGAIDAPAAGDGVKLEAITPPGMPLADALRQADRNLAAAVVRCFL